MTSADLRAMRARAHAAFDAVWRGRWTSRGQAYAWLAERLGIEPASCHIGRFDAATCQRVIDLCGAHPLAAEVPPPEPIDWFAPI